MRSYLVMVTVDWLLVTHPRAIWACAWVALSLAGLVIAVVRERRTRRRGRSPPRVLPTETPAGAAYRNAGATPSVATRSLSRVAVRGLAGGLAASALAFGVAPVAALAWARAALERTEWAAVDNEFAPIGHACALAATAPWTRAGALEALISIGTRTLPVDATSLDRLEALGRMGPHCRQVVTALWRGHQLARAAGLAQRCNVRDVGPRRTSGPGYDGVVFPAEAPRTTWQPTNEDIAQLESRLPAFLRAMSLRTDAAVAPDLASRIRSYKRQYFGHGSGNGRWIEVNFFCDDFAQETLRGTLPDWRLVEVSVSDGGDCFLRVKYDVASGAFRDLMVNGHA